MKRLNFVQINCVLLVVILVLMLYCCCRNILRESMDGKKPSYPGKVKHPNPHGLGGDALDYGTSPFEAPSNNNVNEKIKILNKNQIKVKYLGGG